MAEETGPLSQDEIDALIASMSSAAKAPDALHPDSAESAAKEPPVPAVEPQDSVVSINNGPHPDPGKPGLGALPVAVRAELGRSVRPVKDVLQIGVGTRLVLDRRWQDPVLLTINGHVVGTGIVVLVGNRLGVKVVDWGVATDGKTRR